MLLNQVVGAREAAAPPPDGDWQDDAILLPPNGKAIFGVYAGGQSSLPAIETQYGHQIRLTNLYSVSVTDLSCVTRSQSQLNVGRTPRLDWGLSRAYDGLGFNVSNVGGKSLFRAIADGDLDAAGTSPNSTPYLGLTTLMTGLGNLTAGGCPTNKIFFSLCHEVDLVTEEGGDGTNWSGSMADFRAMWHHLHDMAQTVGATNLVWFLNLAFNPQADGGNHKWGDTLTDTDSDGLYPGHLYVDWIGWDPYNWAGVPSHSPHTVWESFSSIQNKGPYHKLDWWKAHFDIGALSSGVAKPYKPVMLGETGTCEYEAGYTGEPGDAEVWVKGIPAYLNGSGKNILRAVIYFSVTYSDHDRSFDGPTNDGATTPQKWAGLADIGNATDPANTALQY